VATKVLKHGDRHDSPYCPTSWYRENFSNFSMKAKTSTRVLDLRNSRLIAGIAIYSLLKFERLKADNVVEGDK
jgi:hypothetical protein